MILLLFRPTNLVSSTTGESKYVCVSEVHTMPMLCLVYASRGLMKHTVLPHCQQIYSLVDLAHNLSTKCGLMHVCLGAASIISE